jgi:hypothetical protein
MVNFSAEVSNEILNKRCPMVEPYSTPEKHRKGRRKLPLCTKMYVVSNFVIK